MDLYDLFFSEEVLDSEVDLFLDEFAVDCFEGVAFLVLTELSEFF